MISQTAIPYFKGAGLLLIGLFTGIVLVQYQFKDVSLLDHIPTSFMPNVSFFDRQTAEPESPPEDPVLRSLEYLMAMYHDQRVDCPAVAADNTSAMDAAIKVVNGDFKQDKEAGFIDFSTYFLRLSQSCSKLITQYGFINDSLSEEERDFPIAFSIIAYKEIEMLVRLLRAIYRPQNYYCIHLDGMQTEKNMFEAVTAISKCFPNVLMADKRLNVTWATITSLEADMVCMETVWKYKKWKYYINLTGQEFPLKTNYEMVKILKTYKGANDIPGTTTYVRPGRIRHRTFPLGLRPIKGPVHVTLSRGFVDFLLHDNTTNILLKFLSQPMFGPDEFFFSVLNHNPQLKIPGSFTGDLTKIEPPSNTNQEYQFIGNVSFNRYKMWMYEGPSKCAKNNVRLICILTTGDLPRMAASPYLFGNKFYLNEDRVVIGCLEEMLMARTIDYYLGRRDFNLTRYENAPFVQNSLSEGAEGVWHSQKE